MLQPGKLMNQSGRAGGGLGRVPVSIDFPVVFVAAFSAAFA